MSERDSHYLGVGVGIAAFIFLGGLFFADSTEVTLVAVGFAAGMIVGLLFGT